MWVLAVVWVDLLISCLLDYVYDLIDFELVCLDCAFVVFTSVLNLFVWFSVLFGDLVLCFVLF